LVAIGGIADIEPAGLVELRLPKRLNGLAGRHRILQREMAPTVSGHALESRECGSSDVTLNNAVNRHPVRANSGRNSIHGQRDLAEVV
jgi:hypothetical protein